MLSIHTLYAHHKYSIKFEYALCMHNAKCSAQGKSYRALEYKMGDGGITRPLICLSWCENEIKNHIKLKVIWQTKFMSQSNIEDEKVRIIIFENTEDRLVGVGENLKLKCF